jgi:hypothetical protein
LAGDVGARLLDEGREPFPIVDGAAFLQGESFFAVCNCVSDLLGMGVHLASLHHRLDKKGRTVHCVLFTGLLAFCFGEGLSHSPRGFCFLASLMSFLTCEIGLHVVLPMGAALS